MNDLRLILLLLGLATIVGIYAWETRSQRDRQRRATVAPQPESRVAAVPPAAEPDFTLDDAGALESVATEPVPHPGAQGAASLIAIHVTAQAGKSFAGPAIAAAAAAAGFEHGAMRIFHYFGVEGTAQAQPLFSMANMFEPGYFDAAAMQDFSTRGLTLFMDPAMADAGLTLELMLKTAEFIAETLGGELAGPDRQRLDARAIQKLREQAGRGATAAGVHGKSI